MDDKNVMVEKSNHELKQQLEISDDILISKFSNDFSLKLLSPLIRLKKGLHLSLPELVSRSRDRDLNSPGENGQANVGVRGECDADTRLTNNDGLESSQSIHEETLEITCEESGPLGPELREAVKVNEDLMRTENVADKQVIKIRRKRGRPPKICKPIGSAVSKSTSSSKKPHRESILASHSNAQKVKSNTVHNSSLSGATKSRRNIPFRNPKRSLTALKDTIVRDYPLRKLFQSPSRNAGLPKRFLGFADVFARSSSAHSNRKNRTLGVNKDKQHITVDSSEARDISQDRIESAEGIAENHGSKLCGEPGDTARSVEQTVSNENTGKTENCNSASSTISPGKCSLTRVMERTRTKKRSPKILNLVRCHSVERLPSLPLCVDPTAKVKTWEPYSRCCGKHGGETQVECSSTDSVEDCLSELPSLPSNEQKRKRGRPPKRKERNVVESKQIPSRLVQSWRQLTLRKYNKSEMTPSRNGSSLEIVPGMGEPQEKRRRGRQQKHRTTHLLSQKNCQEKSHHVQKSDKSKLPDTDKNSNQFFVPESMECEEEEKDLSLLHDTLPNAERDESVHVSSAIWAPGWKDRAVLEYQDGSDQVACLTPPGSNECLSTISGDEYPQTMEEPNMQKACHIPSNINSLSSAAQDSVSGITSPSSSYSGLPQLPQGATTADSSPELLDRIASCSPAVLQEETSHNMCVREQNNKSNTFVSQGYPQDIVILPRDDSNHESDGLSQVRIAKTVTLSKEFPSSCTQSEDVEVLHGETNLKTSSKDVLLKVVEPSSAMLRKERKNIFQALRGGLNSDRDLNQSGSNNWHIEACLGDPEIPQLEAYGGGHGGYASHTSPHAGDFDTLPILEKQAFHDTCLDDDDDDEFEFENPSDVNSDLNEPLVNATGQDYSLDWTKESGSPGPDVDKIIAIESVHQDLLHEATGIVEDEDEFEFETPEETDTTPVGASSLEECPPESHIESSDSLSAKQQCLHEDRNTGNSPHKMVEQQRESELQSADDQRETSFPVIGVSPIHMEYASLQSSESIEDQDCTPSRSNNPDNVSNLTCKDSTNEPNGNNNTVPVSERVLLQTPSKDVEEAGIISVQNDPQTNSITSKCDNTSEESVKCDETEDEAMQELVQQSVPDKSNDEPTTECSDERPDPAECNDKHDEPNTSEELSDDHSQTDTLNLAAIAKYSSDCRDTEDVIGQSQAVLPVTDGEESPNPTDDKACSSEVVNEETSSHSKLCDLEESKESKPSTSVHEETIATSSTDSDGSNSTSQGIEDELSSSRIVVHVQHSDMEATHPSLPVCKPTSEDVLESSKKTNEDACILQENDDCAEVIQLQDELEEPCSTSNTPEVKELQEPKELGDSEKKNSSPSKDSFQQSKSSKISSVEEAENLENQEHNSQPCSPNEKCTDDGQSTDPQDAAELDQGQKESAKEEPNKDCPTKSEGKDLAFEHEPVNKDLQPNGSCEGLANNTDTSQDRNDCNDSAEQLIVEETIQPDQDGLVYMGVSTSDGTIDMLSIACEETIGGYDEDAMSTTSSGAATLPYPLSDMEDWNEQHENVEKDDAQLELGKSPSVQDTPNQSTAAHGKDGDHPASSSTAFKLTVKFAKAKKRKRSRDRHHTKRKRKSNKKHKHSKGTSKEQENKRHLEKPLVPYEYSTIESKSDVTAVKLPEKQDLEQKETSLSLLEGEIADKELTGEKETSTSHLEEVVLNKEPSGEQETCTSHLEEVVTCKEPAGEKETSTSHLEEVVTCKEPAGEQETSTSHREEVVTDKESTGGKAEKPLIETKIPENVENQKSTQEKCSVSNISCELPNSKSPTHQLVHKASAAETVGQVKMVNPIKVQHLRKELSNVFKGQEILNISTCRNTSSTSAEIGVTSYVEDPVMIVDNTPNTPASSQESHIASVPVVSKAPMSHFQTSGIVPKTKNVPYVVKSLSMMSPSESMVDHQKQIRSVAGKRTPGANSPQHISQDKATFFGTPRKDRKKIRRQQNIQHPAMPYPERFYIPPSQQSTQLLQQKPHLPLIPLRNPYLKPSGACNELKQHLLSKKRLVAMDLQKQMDHQPQGQPAVPEHMYLPNHNPNLPNPMIHPSERDMALQQLAQLQMQSQIERDQQNANTVNKSNEPSTFPPGQVYPERFLHSSQRGLPFETNMIRPGAPNISSMPVGLGHEDSDRLQLPGSRITTAGTFSPPVVEDMTRKVQQIHNNAGDSRVGFSISPGHQHVGYAANIPVYATTGPKEQVLAVYPDGYRPVVPNDLSHLNLPQNPPQNTPQNLHHATKPISTKKQPQSNPGKILSQAHVDQDKMLNMLRQLHGGPGTMRNAPVIQDLGESPTSSIPFPSRLPHISETKQPNEIPPMNPQPPSTSNPMLHQPLNQSTWGYSSNATLRELAIQRENLVNSQYMLLNPHLMQTNQETSAAINYTNTNSRTPTPKIQSRTPTPKSCTSAAYVSDHSVNLARQPSSEIDRTSVSRNSTPHSHCTPSSSPHAISDSALPRPTEVQRTQLLQNNFTPDEDMPLDLTCKVRPKVNVQQKYVSPLDLSCKQRTCDYESQEQYTTEDRGNVNEESRMQDNPEGSRTDPSSSDIAEAYGHQAQAFESQSHVQLEMDHSGNTVTTLEPDQDICSESAGYVSNQDSGKFSNSDLHSSNPRCHEISSEVTEAANSLLESGQLSVQKPYEREGNVYVDRAGQPRVFSELMHSGLAAEGPGLKISKTYNKFANPPTIGTSSVPLMDLNLLPKKNLMVRELRNSSVEVHHRQEQVSYETNTRVQTNFQDQPMNVTHSSLRRTTSDQTEVRHSSCNSSNATTASQVGVLDSGYNQPEVSLISPTNLSRSVSASDIAVTSTELKQAEKTPEQLKSFMPPNPQSVSDMSQCPKKRFQRAHEASLKQSVASISSETPGVTSSGEVTQLTVSLRPPSMRKRGRPRGSGNKTYRLSKSEITVNQQCKFCEFETTTRQDMKNHVNEIHFEKYRTKAASDKSPKVSTSEEARQDQDTRKCDKSTDEHPTPVTYQTGLDASGSKSSSQSPSKDDDMPEEIFEDELSQEMPLTGTDHCHHCDIDFPDTSSLAAHQRTHHQSEKKMFKCRLCDYSECTPGPLVVHINKAHSKQLKEGPCPFLNCSRTFPTLREVKEHLNDHWIVKQYACKICGIRYQVFSSLKAHLDRHKQDLPNMCKVCTLSFKTPGTLLRHQKLKGHLPKS